MFTKDFWVASANRAIRTVAQTMIASIGTSAVLSDVNWGYVLSASILAGVISILTSIVIGIPETKGDSDGSDQGDNCE